jgi:hypothetical protein
MPGRPLDHLTSLGVHVVVLGTFNTQSRAPYDSYLAGASAVDWIICTGPRSPDGTSFESAL